MEDFVSFFLILIVITILYLYLESKSLDVKFVKSDVDNKTYLVRNLPDGEEAANLLANIKKKLSILVDSLRDQQETNQDIKRLISNWRPDNISESSPNNKYTSYSINKGEKIVFCIRSRDSTNKLVAENTMMFVAIHELAHLMTKSIGHTKEFWDNMRFLLKKAIDMKIYTKQDFKSNPQPYCGTQITDSPLK
jgi:predicted metal-dependent hydrolase